MTRGQARPEQNNILLFAAIILCVTAILTLIPAVPAYGHEYKSNALIVKYKADITQAQAQAINEKHGLKTEMTINRLNAQTVNITDITPVELKVQELKSDPAVEYAEPDYERSASITCPNDSYYGSYQWNLPKIQADYAWDIQRGNANVIIAVLDTGVSLSHPDLAGKLVAGYDFAANDSNPTDENGHGTHVAGIAAAVTNNGMGVAGVSWNSRIMPVRVLDAGGMGWDSDIAEGIIWAADNGADVINMSLAGPSSYPQTLQNAVDYAHSRGVTVVAAAGNVPSGGTMYPAACTDVIGVAATDSADNRASFSSYGSFVDIAAPGVSIISSYWTYDTGNTYGTGSGTSMAAPHVAGLAALVLAQYPSATPDQVATAIQSTAVDLGTPGRDNYYGYGRINALAAINFSGFVVDHFDITVGSPQAAGQPFLVTVTAKDSSEQVKTSFVGAVSLSDTSGTISPTTTANFSAGVWSGNVTITKAGTTTITAAFGYPPRTGASQITVNPGSLSSVGVFPPAASLKKGNTLVFTATGYDSFNNPLSGLSFTWDVSGGTVNPGSGTSTTFTAGNATGDNFLIQATSPGNVTGQARICIGIPYADFNADGLSDITILYDYGYATSRLWAFKSNGSGFTASQAWYSGQGGFDANRSKLTSGDFDGDGKSDTAVLYNYGNATSGLWLFKSNGTNLNPSLAWFSAGFDANRAKITAGDFDGDGRSDVAVLYDYGNATSGLWLFKSNGTNLNPSLAWYSGGFDANRAKMVSGNFDGDAGVKSDVAILYDYGNSTSGLWIFKSNGATLAPSLAWYSGPGGFDANRAKLTGGDYNDDDKSDVAILYDYGNATSRIWVFKSNGTNFSPSMAWYGGQGGFDANRAKLFSGDFDGDEKSDVSMLYDYGNATSRFWLFKSDGTNFSPSLAWYGGLGGFDANWVK